MQKGIPTLALLFIFIAGFLAGCASGPKAQFPTGFDIARFNHLRPTVSFADKDLTDNTAVERIRVAIIRELKKIQGQPFADFATTNNVAGTLSIEVMITRYERGNAAMRAALAGLGQIHIDGDVAISSGDPAQPIAEYQVKKTFAWGGMMGAATHIEDVEEDFAKEVIRPLEDLIRKGRKAER